MSDDETRTKKLLIVSKRLLIFTAVILAAIVLLFAVTYFRADRLMLSWIVFGCGIVGGFVSIQQRIRKIDTEELTYLSQSWATILVIPIFGGVFALVLYVLFLAGIVQGHLFPSFYVPPFGEPPTTDDVARFLSTTYPKTGSDLAKLMFWSFVAGFSERFVPQIVQSVSERSGDGK